MVSDRRSRGKWRRPDTEWTWRPCSRTSTTALFVWRRWLGRQRVGPFGTGRQFHEPYSPPLLRWLLLCSFQGISSCSVNSIRWFNCYYTEYNQDNYKGVPLPEMEWPPAVQYESCLNEFQKNNSVNNLIAHLFETNCVSHYWGSHSPGGKTVTASRNSSTPANRWSRFLAR